MHNDDKTDKTSADTAKPSTRQVAERLFEAFRAVGPFKRRPGFGHAARPGEFQLDRKSVV